jgi:hypothetical protein
LKKFSLLLGILASFVWILVVKGTLFLGVDFTLLEDFRASIILGSIALVVMVVTTFLLSYSLKEKNHPFKKKTFLKTFIILEFLGILLSLVFQQKWFFLLMNLPYLFQILIMSLLFWFYLKEKGENRKSTSKWGLIVSVVLACGFILVFGTYFSVKIVDHFKTPLFKVDYEISTDQERINNYKTLYALALDFKRKEEELIKEYEVKDSFESEYDTWEGFLRPTMKDNHIVDWSDRKLAVTNRIINEYDIDEWDYINAYSKIERDRFLEYLTNNRFDYPREDITNFNESLFYEDIEEDSDQVVIRDIGSLSMLFYRRELRWMEREFFKNPENKEKVLKRYKELWRGIDTFYSAKDGDILSYIRTSLNEGKLYWLINSDYIFFNREELSDLIPILDNILINRDEYRKNMWKIENWVARKNIENISEKELKGVNPWPLFSIKKYIKLDDEITSYRVEYVDEMGKKDFTPDFQKYRNIRNLKEGRYHTFLFHPAESALALLNLSSYVGIQENINIKEGSLLAFRYLLGDDQGKNPPLNNLTGEPMQYIEKDGMAIIKIYKESILGKEESEIEESLLADVAVLK